MAFDLGAFLKRYMPTGLFPRSLLIIVMPVVVTQIIITFVFLERHWNTVTQRLSNAVVSDIAFLAELRMKEQGSDSYELSQLANDTFDMSVAFLPGETLPPPVPTPIVALLDSSLSSEISSQIGRAFWIDTSTYDNYVDIRILLPGEVMRVLTQRKRVYATNTHIFLIYMTGTSALLLLISGIFLRNQVRPIQRLAEAAERFGKGVDMPNFRPSGAAEVRSAAASFMKMRDRIQRQIEQRTTMLAGVSHDLRTPLTRLKLQLAMLPQGPETEALSGDINEMENMLNDYLAFAKGYAGESAKRTVLKPFLENITQDTRRRWPNVQVKFIDCVEVDLNIKPNAFKRCVSNLINNACAHAPVVHLTARRSHDEHKVEIYIDDNGPGIPDNKLDEVFRPFYRLDDARTANLGGTGLGLAIALDIARGHGGDIKLQRSNLGGLGARISIPV
jgi:two-component system, OmpR family, osmolarity sensor histidine kinase EnvZ